MNGGAGLQRIARFLARAALVVATLTTGASAQYQAPQHLQPTPFLGALPPEQAAVFADLGLTTERDRDPAWQLAEHRRLDKALGQLQPQRKGVIDAYVIAIALDSDPVFGREAREAGRVLSRRYDAAGRTIVLAGSDGAGPSALPRGSPDTLALALARIGELMDPREDVLILYTTSHGAPLGLVYNDADQGFGLISPQRLWTMLGKTGIERRMLLVSACYAGTFVPLLANDDSVVITASSADRTSFGCQADSDWTFFGDALINNALRKSQPLAAAAGQAVALIDAWERRGKLTPSQPQVSIGANSAKWLAALDTRVPTTASAPVGRPAVSLLNEK